MDGLGAPTEDVKLQLLQLRCIIDAKDREIQLLRTHLTGQEQDADSMAASKAEVTHLRGEVQRLTTERDALRTQQAASPQAASSASDGGAPAETQQRAAVRPSVCSGGEAAFQAHMGGGGPPNSSPNITDGRSQPVSPGAGMTVDPAALVDKLRSLVSSLVAEVLAAQQRPAGQSPNLLQHQHHTRPTTAAARHSLASTQAPRLAQPQHHFSMGRPSGRSFWGAVEQLQAAATPAMPVPQTAAPQAHPATVLLDNTTAVDSHSSGVRMSLPGVLVHIVPAPPLPLGPHPTPAAAAEGRTLQAPSSAKSASGSAAGGAAAMGAAADVRAPASGGPVAAPAVLELNVDGTTVYVERAVLESQAAGSRLHHMLITDYGRLPLDAQGRPFLSYDPRVFQVLMGHLKERHLFGSPVAAGESRDWSRPAESLGVSPHYFAQVASHFGLTDPAPPPPPQQQQQQQQQRQFQARAAAASTAPHNTSTPVVAPPGAADLMAATPSITSVASGVPNGAIPTVASGTSFASLVHIGTVSSTVAGIAAPVSSVSSAASVTSPGPIRTAPADNPTATAVAAGPAGPIAPSGSYNPFVNAGSMGLTAPVDPTSTAGFAGSIATTTSIAATAPASTGSVTRVGAAGSVNSVASAAPMTPATSAASIASAASVPSAAPTAAAGSVGPVAPPSLPVQAGADLSPSPIISPQASRQARGPDPAPIAPGRGSQGSPTGASSGSAAAGGLPHACSGEPDCQPWGQLPSLRVPVQPRDSSRGLDMETSNCSSNSVQQLPSAAAQGLLQREAPSVATVQTPERSLAPATVPVLDGAGGAPAATATIAAAGAVADAAASQVGPLVSGPGSASASALQSKPSGASPLSAVASFQSPSQQHSAALRTALPSSPSSRIPPPPPQQKPAAAPSLAAVGSAPSVGSLTPPPASGSQETGPMVPGWWQPFSDEPAQGAVVAAASQAQSSQNAPAPAASLTAAPSAKASLTVTDEISVGGPFASVASGAIAAAALGEQYRVGNLYTILAEKQRAEAEAGAGAGAGA